MAHLIDLKIKIDIKHLAFLASNIYLFELMVKLFINLICYLIFNFVSKLSFQMDVHDWKNGESIINS